MLGIVVRHRLVGSVGESHQTRSSRTWHLLNLDDDDSLDEDVRGVTDFLGEISIVEGTRNDLVDARKIIFGDGLQQKGGEGN